MHGHRFRTLTAQAAAPIDGADAKQSIQVFLYYFLPETLFYFDSGAGIDELLLNRLRFILAHAFFHVLGRAIYQVFGFFQAQAGDFANGFDDVNFVY